MRFQTRVVHVGETHIHLAIAGKGTPLVLVHGMTNNWEGHIPIAAQLARKYTVYIPDLPGYGDSGSLPSYGIRTMAAYVGRLVLVLRIKPRAIIGLSMGGIITAELVRLNPRITKKAVIMGPVLRDKWYQVDAMKYIFTVLDAVPGGRSILKKVVETRTHAYWSAKYLNMYHFDKRLVDRFGMIGKKKMTKDAYVEMGLSVAGYDLLGTLRTIRTPALLLYGREDRMSSPVYAKTHAIAMNKRLTLVVIPEAGHVVSFEKPRESARAIESFIGGTGNSASRRNAAFT